MWEWIDRASVIIGIVVALPVFYTAYQVYVAKRRRREWHRTVRQEPGLHPAVLVIDLLTGKEIREQVVNFCGQAGIGYGNRFFVVDHQATLTPDDVPAVVEEVRRHVAEAMRSGATTLHLFYGGPTSVASLVGAELANAGFEVIVYQNQAGRYVSFGPLRPLRVE